MMNRILSPIPIFAAAMVTTVALVGCDTGSTSNTMMKAEPAQVKPSPAPVPEPHPPEPRPQPHPGPPDTGDPGPPRPPAAMPR